MIRAILIVLILCAGCFREVDLTHGADAAPPDGIGSGFPPDAQFAPDDAVDPDGPGPLPDAGLAHD